jgi:hypothetical protein
VLPDQLSNCTFFVAPRYEEAIGDIRQAKDRRLSHMAGIPGDCARNDLAAVI